MCHLSSELSVLGTMLSNALVNAGMVSFQRLEDTNPREIELVSVAPYSSSLQPVVTVTWHLSPHPSPLLRETGDPTGVFLEDQDGLFGVKIA